MRHRVAGKKLNRAPDQRLALRRGLVTELFRHGAIQTTEAKADAVRGMAEKLITTAKRSIMANDPIKVVNARRIAAAQLHGNEIVKKLFDELAPKFIERPGGYTRVYKLGRRHGDAASMVQLELVIDEEVEVTAPDKKTADKKQAKKK
jgi:large subunit ribosomal protein L17